MTTVIRPELLNVERRPITVGQVWTVDEEPSARWFVIAPDRVIALFAGASDHTARSLVYTYGDRLRLEQIATVYAAPATTQTEPIVTLGVLRNHRKERNE